MSKLTRFVKKRMPKKLMNTLNEKRIKPVQGLKADSYSPEYSYTIISAAYNAAPYLDDYFKGILAQTADKGNLKVVIVDDGSTDNTADIVREWQARFPELIELRQKENGGQASARNLGMDELATDWVIFIDPDDFIALDFFERADRAFAAHPKTKIATVNTIFFMEDTGEYRNSHPLKWRFSKGDRFFDINDEENLPPILSMATTFLSVSELNKAGLRARTDIRPNFEDAHFVNTYMLNVDDGEVGYLESVKYYYRKRSDKSSTLDKSWEGTGRLICVPEKGLLGLRDNALAVKGFVPDNIKQTLLYEITWVLRYYIGHPERSSHLSPEEINKSYDILEAVIKTIGVSGLFDSRNKHLGFDTKAALCYSFLDELPPFQKVYLRRVDTHKRSLVFQCFCEMPEILLNGKSVDPIEVKRADRTFLGRRLYDSFTFHAPYDSLDDTLEFRFNAGMPVQIESQKVRFDEPVQIDALIHPFTKNWSKYKQVGDTWIIMDRDTTVDDNGEHFYRYMMEHHPEQRCLYAVRIECPDWDRLKNEGFNLLAFGSREFEKELKACSKIISSHIDAYIASYFVDYYYYSKDIIFLQHGITKDNISNWMNSKRNMTMMVAATKAEYDSIVGEGSPYNLSSQEVKLTGFPRHDRLLSKGNEHQDRTASRMILIMPTWRQDLVGAVVGKGNSRELNPDFIESLYHNAWQGLLDNPLLQELAADGTEIVFFPHTNMAPYVKAGMFKLPEYITYLDNNSNVSMQDLFARSSLMITDYSSTAFEEAYILRPVIYYHFTDNADNKPRYHFNPGYFSYERDGFGPVVHTESDLVSAIRDIAENDFQMADEYKTRALNTFTFRDGQCCERVYEEIIHLHDRADAS